jgi:7-carboxy-7-deazaguanine synthase
MTVGEVAGRVAEIGCPRVFVTGGEPLLWKRPLSALLRRFREEGRTVMLQSNGTIYSEEVFALCDQVSLDCKTPSSGEASDYEVVRRAVAEAPSPQVKFVVRDEEDYAYADAMYRRLAGEVPVVALERCAFVLQPMDAVGRDDRDALIERLRWLQETVQRRGDWHFRPLPQLHVLMYGSEKKGV